MREQKKAQNGGSKDAETDERIEKEDNKKKSENRAAEKKGN